MTSYVNGFGADVLHWIPGGIDSWIAGDGGETYDDNVYMDKTGGDRLFVEGGPVRLQLSTTEDGVARVGTSSLTFEGVERIHLSGGNDVIRAGQAAAERWGLSIWAGGGNDDIIGSRAGDFIDGGAGNDTIRAGGGNDFIQSSTGNDLIYGGAGDDNIRWGIGNAHEHDPGNDTIFGGAGHDLINVWDSEGWGWDGARVPGAVTTIERVFADGAMKGMATIGNGHGTSKLQFQGFEQGWNHEGMDTVDGSSARIDGTTGIHWNTRWSDDRLTGTSGNDTLEGGTGRDTITGGKGDDLISANGDFYSWDAPGDGDRDTLIFRSGDGHDTVLAFDPGRDVLDLGGRSYHAQDTRDGMLLDFGDGDSILMVGVHDLF